MGSTNQFGLTLSWYDMTAAISEQGVGIVDHRKVEDPQHHLPI